MIFPRFFLICSITLFSLGTANADNPYTGSTSVFVNYVNAATNTDLHESPTIYLSFDDKDERIAFIMDTGSVGIVASTDYFKHAKGAKNLGKGRQIYSSSGIIEEGIWWTATQKIYDSNGTLLATSTAPVLEVTKIRCTKHARKCHRSDHPTGISVMGIGFAGETKLQPRGTPQYNPFLNLQTVLQGGVMLPLPSDWCNGYIVTPTGVFLGLTASNTTDAGWVKLIPWPQYSTPTLPEWMRAPMTVNANGESGAGNILMDTGVGDGFLTPPPGANMGTLVQCPSSTLVECAPNGDVIGVYLPNQANPVAFYNFTVGDSSNLMEPEGVHVDENETGTFFNTSRHVLGGINFIYDNTNGYIGYIWNGLSGPSVGYVIPAVSTTTTTLATSVNPVAFGNRVDYTATVVGVDPSIIPTGTVTFVIDKMHQPPVPVDANGRAQFSISTLPPVAHTIQARYSGDATFIRSASPVLTQRVNPPTCF